MKKLYVFTVLCICLMSCDSNLENEDKPIEISGQIQNPQENLPWLKELIQKAETDKTGNYAGCIWLEKTDDGKELFVTNMMLGSGGIMYWFFDRDGNHYVSHDTTEECPACAFVGENKHVYFEEDFPLLSEIKRDSVIYSPSFLSNNYK